MVSAIRESMSSGGGTCSNDGNQVVEKVWVSPAATSNSSSWWPSWAWGSRLPLSTSMSGPATAVMTSPSSRWPTLCDTHGRTLP